MSSSQLPETIMKSYHLGIDKNVMPSNQSLMAIWGFAFFFLTSQWQFVRRRGMQCKINRHTEKV